jgi:lysozyme family protein
VTPDQQFAIAVKIILDDEGVMSDDPKNDPDGGLTKFGWSQKQNPDIDVVSLTHDSAVTLYRQRIWTPAGCDATPWPLSLLLFDSAVNQGVATAVRLLQRSLPAVQADGLLGPETLARVRNAEPWDLTARFTAVRLQSYVRDKEYLQDGQGWFYRVAKNLLAAGRSAG